MTLFKVKDKEIYRKEQFIEKQRFAWLPKFLRNKERQDGTVGRGDLIWLEEYVDIYLCRSTYSSANKKSTGFNNTQANSNLAGSMQSNMSQRWEIVFCCSERLTEYVKRKLEV